jgi:exopolysaccharide production protein ExoQ
MLLLSEKVFAILSFIHYSGGPIFLIVSNGISEGEYLDPLPSFALVNNSFLLIYFITFCLLVLRWKNFLVVFTRVNENSNCGIDWHNDVFTLSRQSL